MKKSMISIKGNESSQKKRNHVFPQTLNNAEHRKGVMVDCLAQGWSGKMVSPPKLNNTSADTPGKCVLLK